MTPLVKKGLRSVIVFGVVSDSKVRACVFVYRHFSAVFLLFFLLFVFLPKEQRRDGHVRHRF
jgi:hypothetical protein